MLPQVHLEEEPGRDQLNDDEAQNPDADVPRIQVQLMLDGQIGQQRFRNLVQSKGHAAGGHAQPALAEARKQIARHCRRRDVQSQQRGETDHGGERRNQRKGQDHAANCLGVAPYRAAIQPPPAAIERPRAAILEHVVREQRNRIGRANEHERYDLVRHLGNTLPQAPSNGKPGIESRHARPHTVPMLYVTRHACWIVPALLLGAARSSAEVVPLDGYAAMVNDRVITMGEVLATAAPLDEAARMDAVNPLDLQQRLQKNYTQALDLQIEQALLVEEAKRRTAEKPELTLPERVIDDQVLTVIREQFGGRRDEFIRYMADAGMTMEEYRKKVRERIDVYRMLREEVQSRVLLPPASVRAEYDRRAGEFRSPEEVHMRMIMIHKGDTQEQAAIKMEQARKARARIQAGESFSVVAQSVSEGYHATEGGDMGWIKPKDFKESLNDAIKALRTGEVSEVVDGGDGYYILEMMGRKEAVTRSFEEVRPELEKQLQERAEDDIRKEFINRLRARHFVRVLIPERPDLP